MPMAVTTNDDNPNCQNLQYIFDNVYGLFSLLALHVQGELRSSTLAIASKRPYSPLSTAFKLVCMDMRKVQVQMTDL
jgi:hypothetical protein